MKFILLYLIIFALVFILINMQVYKKNNFTIIYAFMRVKDEEFSILSSLSTLLPYINYGVIAYNAVTDNSEIIIQNFCKKHKKFNYIKYPFYVIPVNSELYLKRQNYDNRLDSYYNFALIKIPNYNWLLKTDADEIYNSFVIHNITLNKDNRKYLICLPRLNMYLIKCRFYSLKKNFIINPCDQWLFFKTGEEFFAMDVRNNSGIFHAYELLKFGKKKVKSFNKISILHISHINRDIEKKYSNEEMVLTESLIKSETNTITSNDKMIKEMKKMENKCQLKLISDLENR